MNAIVPTQSRNALVPQGFDQAMRFADVMAKSKMVPRHFQGKPEECLVIIEQAMRWEMSPYAVIQCASMIHDRPMYEGKLVAAVVNARGPAYGLQGRLHFDYTGANDTRKITVWGMLDGRREEVECIIRDVRTSNEQWKKQPDQQLAYHGSRVWARRHMPELMLGVYSPEEFERGGAPQETFTGPTIDSTAETPPEAETPHREATWYERFIDRLSAEPDGPKWFDIFREEMATVPTRDDVVAVQGSKAVKQLRRIAPDDVIEELDAILKAAHDKFPEEAEYMPADTEAA